MVQALFSYLQKGYLTVRQVWHIEIRNPRLIKYEIPYTESLVSPQRNSKIFGKIGNGCSAYHVSRFHQTDNYCLSPESWFVPVPRTRAIGILRNRFFSGECIQVKNLQIIASVWYSMGWPLDSYAPYWNTWPCRNTLPVFSWRRYPSSSSEIALKSPFLFILLKIYPRPPKNPTTVQKPTKISFCSKKKIICHPQRPGHSLPPANIWAAIWSGQCHCWNAKFCFYWCCESAARLSWILDSPILISNCWERLVSAQEFCGWIDLSPSSLSDQTKHCSKEFRNGIIGGTLFLAHCENTRIRFGQYSAPQSIMHRIMLSISPSQIFSGILDVGNPSG